MAIRTADAEWQGNLAEGSGHTRPGSDAFEGSCDFRSQMREGKGRIQRGCSAPRMRGASRRPGASTDECGLHRQTCPHNGESPFDERDGGWSIHRIDLDREASVVNVAKATFEEHAQTAKKNCLVSRALSGVDIHLLAKLL